MATLTESGRIALAAAVKAKAIHLAWGSGLPEWDATPPIESPSIAALTTEVGRRVAGLVEYVVPDPAGTLIVPVFNGSSVPQKFSLSAPPTKYLYMAFQFAVTDAPAETIREAGVFVDTVTTGSEGQTYFIPAEVADPGMLLAVECLSPKIIRSGSTRKLFEFVLSL